MIVVTRKYNPGFLTDDELVASFCVRTNEFDSILEMLRDCARSASPHQIAIGPRGSGKTSLLLRVATEIRRDVNLSSRFFPIVFAEESYEVTSAGEFWLEALSRLSVQVPDLEAADSLHRTWEDLRSIRDDRALGDRCLGALLDFADRHNKRLVLVVENLNAMFGDMADAEDAGWRLRRILQTEPRILLLASATSRFDAIDNPDRALYDLFRILTLRPLDADECSVLWEKVSGRRRDPQSARALRILTGGSPRLIAILARFGAERSFHELMADLLDLVDDHTEYFKSHLESLPAQERRVYLALAALWKPATAREIADRARLDTSKCSAQLNRLVARGAVEVIGGTPQRKLYYLTERLYNIYYLMRQARGSDPFIKALIRFMVSYYAPDELKEFGARIVRDAAGLDAATQSSYRTAFVNLVSLPALEPHRRDLLDAAPPDWAGGFVPTTTDRKASEDLQEAWALFDKALSLAQDHGFEDALTVCAEAMDRFGDSDSPDVLEMIARIPVFRATVLVSQNRLDDALVAYDDAVSWGENSDSPQVLYWVARSMNGRGAVLERLGQWKHAIAVYGDVAHRFRGNNSAGVRQQVAEALTRAGIALEMSGRWPEAISTYDEILRRFAEDESRHVFDGVARALVKKGRALEVLDRWEEALAAYDGVIRQHRNGTRVFELEMVAQALLGKASALMALDRLEDVLAAFDDIVRRFESSEKPRLRSAVDTALACKGVTLGALHRFEEALAAQNEVVRRLRTREIPTHPEFAALVFLDRGDTLLALDRQEAATDAWNDLVDRFGAERAPKVQFLVASALLNLADIELNNRQYPAAIEKANLVLERYGVDSLENRLRSHLVRAWASLGIGDLSACEQDVMAILTLLPTLDVPPRNTLDALQQLSLELGPERMRELIVASPSRYLLLPLTTALEGELGIAYRVPREIEEIADDIRQDFAKLREKAAKVTSEDG